MTRGRKTGVPERRAAALGALLPLVLLFAGCQGKGAAGICPDLVCDGDPGSPIGTWQVTSVCRFPVVSRPAQNYDTSRGFFQPETGATPPAQTSGPWCFDLSFDMMGNLITPTAPMQNPDYVVSGTVTFSEDHTYLYALTAISAPTNFHVARSCFGVNAASLSCADLAQKLTTVVGANPVYGNNTGMPPFRCSDGGDGCDCSFDYIETENNAVGDRGSWVQEGAVIHHYSISGQGNLFGTSPSRRTLRDATFCRTGDTMELTGANGAPIALKTGTRSLTLELMNPDAGSAAGAGGAGGEAGAGGMGGEAGAGGMGGESGADASSETGGSDAADAASTGN
jgi:hypothetical protein